MSTKNPRFSLNGEGEYPEPLPDKRKKAVVEALTNRYKELNKLWEDAEAELKRIPIPVDAYFSYSQEPADLHNDPLGEIVNIHDHIGFVKSEGGWRICHGRSHDGYPDCEIDWKPITECSVDLRMKAAPHIGELCELVLKTAEECVQKIDKAIADFRSTMKSW